MDSQKLYSAARKQLDELITHQTPVEASIVNDAVAKAIAAAFEEYEKQK